MIFIRRYGYEGILDFNQVGLTLSKYDTLSNDKFFIYIYDL